MKNSIKKTPYAYHITFRTYGTWLHGDPRTSVDPKHNQFLTPRLTENPNLHKAMRAACKEKEFLMNINQSNTVLNSIIDTCNYNQWYLYAAHVRTNHLHWV